MWKKFKKAQGRSPKPRSWSDNDMKIVGWCLSNNISVSRGVDWKNDQNRWLIDIKINNRIHTDPNTYKDEEVADKVYEYYKYYYEKHNKQ